MARLDRLPTFSKDGAVHVVVESPRGSATKLKYEPTLDVMMLGRPLPQGIVFPFDFGFVPRTRGEDGDPLDAMILADTGTWPSVVVLCRAIGVVRASQKDERRPKRLRNDRVIFVATSDRNRDDVKDVADLPARLRDELATFFVAAGVLEDKAVEILGWSGAGAARDAIDRTRRRR